MIIAKREPPQENPNLANYPSGGRSFWIVLNFSWARSLLAVTFRDHFFRKWCATAQNHYITTFSTLLKLDLYGGQT